MAAAMLGAAMLLQVAARWQQFATLGAGNLFAILAVAANALQKKKRY